MDDIKRIKQDILIQVFLHIDNFSQSYLDSGNELYYSPSEMRIYLSPSDYSVLKEALNGR